MPKAPFHGKRNPLLGNALQAAKTHFVDILTVNNHIMLWSLDFLVFSRRWGLSVGAPRS